MLQIQQEYKLIECLSQLLQVKQCAKQVSFYVLMLPDNLHTRIFHEVALLLQTSEKQVREQFQLLTIKYLVKDTIKSPQPTEDLNTTRCYNLIENHPRTQSQASIKFQNRYSEAIQKVMNIQQPDNKKLCQELLNYFENYGSIKFWKQMHELIPEKSKVQLREYFQNSFKRFVHQEYLSQEDKIVLKDLIIQMKDRKPSEIADKFMEIAKDKNYFKRNVIMYVVNMKK
ncbi:Hypothetical_protein [Hexamita inflata]|uniref:Hypothetical_protein n=1 Tax=Hexamita inflata TaxID=28002 RepID=A0AA86RR82_9EUKA|nr:Hypothetical protein HINF_LOCUS58780 [Hexamita inflata]